MVFLNSYYILLNIKTQFDKALFLIGLVENICFSFTSMRVPYDTHHDPFMNAYLQNCWHMNTNSKICHASLIYIKINLLKLPQR